MKREVLQSHSLYSGLDNFEFHPEPEKEFIIPDSEMDRIFREIYTLDEETNLPKGDFAYYMSRDGNPQIKEWLINNLLAPKASQSGTSVEEVTDDMIAEFARKKGESNVDYASRLSKYRDEAVKFIEENKPKSD